MQPRAHLTAQLYTGTFTFHAPRPEVGVGEEVTVVPARGLELGLRPVVRELVAGPAPATHTKFMYIVVN